MLTARSGGAGRDYQGGMPQETLGDRPKTNPQFHRKDERVGVVKR